MILQLHLFLQCHGGVTIHKRVNFLQNQLLYAGHFLRCFSKKGIVWKNSILN